MGDGNGNRSELAEILDFGVSEVRNTPCHIRNILSYLLLDEAKSIKGGMILRKINFNLYPIGYKLKLILYFYTRKGITHEIKCICKRKKE